MRISHREALGRRGFGALLSDTQRQSVREKFQELEFDASRLRFGPATDYPERQTHPAKWLFVHHKPSPNAEVCWAEPSGYFFVFDKSDTRKQGWKGFFSPDVDYISDTYSVETWQELSPYLDRWSKALSDEAQQEVQEPFVRQWNRARNLLLLKQINDCQQLLARNGVSTTDLCWNTGNPDPAHFPRDDVNRTVHIYDEKRRLYFVIRSAKHNDYQGLFSPGNDSTRQGFHDDPGGWASVTKHFEQWARNLGREMVVERLDPLRPLDLRRDGDLYVAPPHCIAKRLMRLLERPGEHVALWGPVGSGKSTELRAAAHLLSTRTWAALTALDLELDLKSEPQEWELQASLCRALIRVAEQQGTQVSQPLRERLGAAGIVDHSAMQGSQLPSRELTGDLIVELRSHRPVTLLVDGLEKATPARARSIARQLVETARDVSLVVVLSPALLTGPDAYEVLQDLNLRSLALRPVVVDPRYGITQAETGRAWLQEVAERRLAASTVPVSILNDAAGWSGGVPRTFLQLLRDAYTSAEFAGRDTPGNSDLLQAQGEHRASLRRLLTRGDLELLKNAAGTSGVEVPLEARVRLLAQGLLLEYEVAGESDPMVEPHPLLRL